MKLSGITDKGFQRLASLGKSGQEEEIPDMLEDESSGSNLDAEELVLFIDNDGELYSAYTVPAYKQLAKFMQKGSYDHDMALRSFMRIVDAGAKKYVKDLSVSRPWNVAFPKEVRMQAAEDMATYFEQLYENGELEGVEKWG